MHRRLVLVTSLAALVLAALPAGASAGPLDSMIAPLSACGGRAAQTDITRTAAQQEATMRCMHNYARGHHRHAGGRFHNHGYLRANTILARSSDLKTADMFRCRQFSHYACGKSTLFHVKNQGYFTGARCWGAGENIAWGTGSYGSVRDIMTRWIYSTVHRTNILNGKFKEVGFGLRRGTFTYNGTPYANSGVWTAHLGYRSC